MGDDSSAAMVSVSLTTSAARRASRAPEVSAAFPFFFAFVCFDVAFLGAFLAEFPGVLLDGFLIEFNAF
ncbi:hypothetical protein FND50_31010 [Rhodococcus sp. WB9]|uniref:hypothetical protein n=1 Tax=Rhodococcus sp. WB9 TaxID=2594007 RepID=UPI001184CE74|nr:hypothetical protein [Rhodococcus sp. WB9]QDQ94776.1 hypothetical protein FND50_31010 [Rhodococcus sp. WB9]